MKAESERKKIDDLNKKFDNAAIDVEAQIAEALKGQEVIWKTRMDEQEAIWKGRMKDLRDDMQSLLREIATLRQQLAEATKVAPPPPLGLVFIYWKRNSLLER